MKTEILLADNKSIRTAAGLLANDSIVAIPTETVYGLAANGFSKEAACKIFAAKGRPSDNPLILHIAEIAMLYDLAREIPPAARILADKFWPGPLTIVFPKTDRVLPCINGGLDTVAVRFPKNETTLALIRSCGFPLAAPSANSSGKPSPTTAQHVYDDLNGKIPLILDGGDCAFGVESTVILPAENGIRILRPGGISIEELSEYVSVIPDSSITESLKPGESPISPGIKYRHYSPLAKVILVTGTAENFNKYYSENYREGDTALIRDQRLVPDKPFRCYGENPEQQAHSIFAMLRLCDKDNVTRIFVHAPLKHGLGLAVYNRLLRAAEFNIIEIK